MLETNNNNQNQISNQTQQQTIYKNLEIESFIESGWVSIKDRETRVLEFIPNKTKIIEKPDFNGKLTKRAQFVVIDINDMSRKERFFEVSRMHVSKIYEELQSGKTILEISRSGSGKDTRYFIKAVR
jgi:hypothetical protein